MGADQDMDRSPFDISYPLPRLRKAVHRVMEKHGQSPFYRKIDWIYKVLRKLQHKGPIARREKVRIRKLINAWLDENTIIHDPEPDSEYKRKVMAEIKNDINDEKRLTRSRSKKKMALIKKKELEDKKTIRTKIVPPEIQIEDENEVEIISVIERRPRKKPMIVQPPRVSVKQEREDVDEETDQNPRQAIPPCPAAIPIAKTQKEILLIDLEEEEDFVPVKLEEIITIRETKKIEDHNRSNKHKHSPENNPYQSGNNPGSLEQPTLPVFVCPVYLPNPLQVGHNLYPSYPYTPMMPASVYNYIDTYPCYQ